MPKLPSQLTEQELLDLLDSEEVVDSPAIEIFDYTGDIVPFMGFYNVIPGDSPVSKRLLYKLYKTYSKEPLDQHNFNIQLGKYINPARDNFLINIDQFAISNHIYEAEKTRDKTKSLAFQKHFDWFTAEAKIYQGNTWTEGFILFHMYKDFCRARRVSSKLGYVNFHKFLKLHFQYRRVRENRALWFKVDYTTSNTYTAEEKNVIRESRKEKTGRSKKEGKLETEALPSE